MPVAENIADIRTRIAAAAHRTGRKPEEVVLMAVSKTVSPDRIREAYKAGLRLFGESRVQEMAAKADALRDLKNAEWHMIGHLQTNKSWKAAELFGAVESVDSVRLAEKLNAATEQVGKTLAVLIEIMVGGEAAKSGLAQESSELLAILQEAKRLPYLEFRGLMTVPPFTEDPDGARPFFRKLRKLRDEIAHARWPSVSMDVLSMGMSHDFEVAVEEGSTCVRVGTALFGERQKDLTTEDAEITERD
jgi:pyridoxal phosphate enzyme (YggS family)